MTVATATNFTISHTIDQGILTDLEDTFDGFRNRIALMSVEACGTLTSMFSPLGPLGIDGDVIDIEAMEWEQFALDLTPAAANQDSVILDFVAA
jgi:hypothetical protein